MSRNRIIALAGGAVVAVLLVVAVLALASGGDDDAAPSTTTTSTTTTVPATTTTSTATTTTTTTSTSTTTTTTTLPAIIRQPLTGEPVPSEADILDRAALVVKIDNATSARRNHTGLANADIVFEEIVEGTITRFAAVFHTQDADPVGPIRSGRSQDVDILTSFDRPLFAWSGGNPGVTRLIAESTLTDLNPFKPTPGYYRGPGVAPHNLYSDTATLWSLTPPDHPGAPPQQYEYVRPEERFVGRPVTRFDLQMDGIPVAWDWNADTGTFERSQVGAPHVDKTYGRIDATNVVVMVTEYRPSQIDARSPEAQTVGFGPAFVFSDGQVVEGVWRRDDATLPIEFVDADGEPIGLTPGSTWIELAERLPEGEATFGETRLDIAYAE